MDGKKGGALKVIPIDGCYLRVRHERLLGDKRKTANAFRTGWVTNISTIHPTACRDVGGTTHAEPLRSAIRPSCRPERVAPPSHR